jgi:hypothetical protein
MRSYKRHESGEDRCALKISPMRFNFGWKGCPIGHFFADFRDFSAGSTDEEGKKVEIC